MSNAQLSADEALKAHRTFLQEVLAEVLPVLSVGAPSPERLVAGLHAYWEACLARREIRCAVLAATANSAAGQVVEPMGTPFEVMVRAELLPVHGVRSADLAREIYDVARAIAVDEALSGERESERRRALIARPAGRGTAEEGRSRQAHEPVGRCPLTRLTRREIAGADRWIQGQGDESSCRSRARPRAHRWGAGGLHAARDQPANRRLPAGLGA